MFAVVVALATSGLGAVDTDPQVLWIEGEAYDVQAGSLGPDRPPFASRGQCLGSNWAGRKRDFAVYRVRLDRPWNHAWLYLRYARLPQSDSHFDFFCDGKPLARRLALKATGGWGHLRDDEWGCRAVRLGKLGRGWHEFKLVSIADENNTNIDGFFLAGESFKPAATRKQIESLPQPVVCRRLDANDPRCVAGELKLEDVSGHRRDRFYPPEEPAQRAALEIPSAVEITGSQASLTAAGGGDPVRVARGGRFGAWRLVEILLEPEPLAVLEREFADWGLIAFLGKQGVVAEVRKSIGRLESIRGPGVAFPADYFDRLLAAEEDIQGRKVLGSGRDPCYEDLAGFLAPCEGYTFLGSPESSEKYVVQPDGTIGLLPRKWGGNKALERVLLDPQELFAGGDPGEGPVAAKRGLLGGYLPAVNYGFVDPSGRFGWELCAFAEAGRSGSVFVRVRRSDGQVKFSRLEPREELKDGKAFFAALLRLQQWWERFFAGGMQLAVDDRRVTDASRAAIARALSGYLGLHPKYGMGGYWGKTDQHDGFPPTTVSLCTCLLDWGLVGAGKARLGYYLDHFVKPDGTLKYYGPAVAEYGELIDLAAAYVRRTGDRDWLERHRPAIERIVDYLLRLRAEGKQTPARNGPTRGLLFGAAEADNHKSPDHFFSGNVWCWRGLLEIGNLFLQIGEEEENAELARRGRQLLEECEGLRADILRAVERSVIPSAGSGFLPPVAGFDKPFATMTENRFASYTNYRYWPEMLSAACLGPKSERMIIDYRVAHGGELLGITRFQDHLDNWPYFHYAYGLLSHDRVSHYLLGYYAHIAHHQTPGTFTAYEQVPIRGYCFRREYADYCVPAQLTTPLMTRWMLVFEQRDEERLWLCRAVPRAWLQSELTLSGALTRWGPVALRIEPAEDLRTITARIVLKSPARPTVMLRMRHPQRMRIADCRVDGGLCEEIDVERELARLKPNQDTMTVTMSFKP